MKNIKRQATGWEKFFASHISNKVFILRIYQELSSSTVKKKANWKMDKRHRCLQNSGLPKMSMSPGLYSQEPVNILSYTAGGN